jgi:hypothetical protein
MHLYALTSRKKVADGNMGNFQLRNRLAGKSNIRKINYEMPHVKHKSTLMVNGLKLPYT